MTQEQRASNEKIEFSRALLKYKNDEKKEMMVRYREALKVFAKNHIPSLMATQSEWNQLFDKF